MQNCEMFGVVMHSANVEKPLHEWRHGSKARTWPILTAYPLIPPHLLFSSRQLLRIERRLQVVSAFLSSSGLNHRAYPLVGLRGLPNLAFFVPRHTCGGR